MHRNGGSVIGFVGDAITCWFDGDEGRRAIACGLAMQQEMAPFEAVPTPGGTIVSLGIKVAVTAGQARRFLVGHPRVQTIEVLAGSIVDRVAAAEQQLQRGEVAAGAEAVERLSSQAVIQEWRADASGEHFAVVTDLTEPVLPTPWPEVPALSAEIARDWLLPPVYQRLQRGEGEFLAELRLAVALLLKFSGIDYDGDDEAAKKLDAYIRWVQTVLARYGGYLIQLTIGDKGSFLYAAFGAPLAHDDDPVRAVAAAMELRDPPGELDYIDGVQIGLTQG
jgi:class 3 adenylate cyclase